MSFPPRVWFLDVNDLLREVEDEVLEAAREERGFEDRRRSLGVAVAALEAVAAHVRSAFERARADG